MEVSSYVKNSRILRFVNCAVHGVAATHFWFAAVYDFVNISVPVDISPIFSSYGRQFKFLTYWDVCVQALYFTYAFGLDVVGFLKKDSPILPKLIQAKDRFEASIAFPISCFVASMFWSLMMIDRELVLPSNLDGYFPNWLNHMEHTNIIVFQILEVVTSPRIYPSHMFSLTVLGAFDAVYIVWMHIVHWASGHWVYPIFEQLNLPLRLVFLLGTVVACFAFYFVGYYLNWILWRKGPVDDEHPEIKYSSPPPERSPKVP